MTVQKNYYFAYGSNLSKRQMALRCPESNYLISGRLSGYSWLINSRGYASIKLSPNAFVLGEIFTLSEQDIAFLDLYEHVAEGMYSKYILSIQTKKGIYDCLVYVASNNDIGKPQTEYIERINVGIKSANFPDDYVDQCIRPFVPEN
tara:strand:- start:247 stop:687 length:441 start_codon:yes stop_codon:yes gene_type:complete